MTGRACRDNSERVQDRRRPFAPLQRPQRLVDTMIDAILTAHADAQTLEDVPNPKEIARCIDLSDLEDNDNEPA